MFLNVYQARHRNVVLYGFGAAWISAVNKFAFWCEQLSLKLLEELASVRAEPETASLEKS